MPLLADLPPLGPSLRTAGRSLLLVVLPTAAVVLGVLALAATRDIPAGYLLRDASDVTQEAPWLGALAALTILLWTATAAVALFGGLTAGRGSASGGLLLGLGAVALLLALDDQYRLHENLLPRFGVPQELVYLAEGLALLAVLWLHRELVLARTDVAVLLLALGLLGLSVGIDVVAERAHLGEAARLVVEDTAKTGGVAALLHYVCLVARDAVRRR